MGKIEEFSINLESSQQVFYPGQKLAGNVTLILNLPMDMRKICIKLLGEGYCHWTESHSSGSGKHRRSRTVHYTGQETIVNQIQVLFGKSATSAKSYKHPNGKHVYPFSFTLPTELPSSFEGNKGHIRYILKAKIDKPWKFDHKVKRAVTINDIIDTNNPMYAEGRGGDVHKTVGCLCCKAGPLDVSASIDRSCFCPGEAIMINATIRNNTTRDLDSVEAKLYQNITYHASRKSRSNTCVVTKLKGPMVPKRQEVGWVNQPFGIPAVPPTIRNSKVITISYRMKVTVGVPLGIDPSIYMDITLGTVPFLKVYGQHVNYGTPEDREQRPEANFIYEIPPPHPSFLGYPDMPPPSYSAVVGTAPTNISKDSDKYTYGDLNYCPVYTFAQPHQARNNWPSEPHQSQERNNWPSDTHQHQNNLPRRPPEYSIEDPKIYIL